MTRSMAQPIFAEYIGKHHIKAIEFKTLNLGTLPPVIYGESIPPLNNLVNRMVCGYRRFCRITYPALFYYLFLKF
jgi:hypothetical protein